MKEIKCTVIDGRKYLVFIIFYITLGTLLSMFVAWSTHQFLFVWLGLAVFWAFPVLFEKVFRKPFSKRAVFSFSVDKLQVQVLAEDQSLHSENVIEFADVKSFKAIESFKDDSAFLRVNLRKGGFVKYNILGQRTIDKDNVIEAVFAYFSNYNQSQLMDSDKIVLRPSFFATPSGANMIYALSLLLLISIIIQIIYLPKSIPASFFLGLSLYVVITQQRRKDIQQKKRLNK